MNATVNFYNEPKAGSSEHSSKQVIVVPQSTIQNGAVYVVVNGRAKKVSVRVGGTTPQGAVVESGLFGGEELISNPPADLKDGQRVEAKH